MKVIWSIVLGLVMVLGQFASASPNGSGGPIVACTDCSCAQLTCCGTASPAAPLSTPGSTSADFRVQAPALVVVAVLTTPEASCSSFVLLSCEHSFSKRAAVPVYDRNCSYLI